MTEVHAVDLIASDIQDAMTALAPKLPTTIEYEAIVQAVVAKHGYYVARMGSDIDGHKFLQVQELKQCANLGHCRHIREYNIPGHACCNCKTVKFTKQQTARPSAYGHEHPCGVLVETPELFARFRAMFAQGQ